MLNGRARKTGPCFFLPTGVPALSRTPYLHIIFPPSRGTPETVRPDRRPVICPGFLCVHRASLGARVFLVFPIVPSLDGRGRYVSCSHGACGPRLFIYSEVSMYELVGWSILIDKMKTYYDALQCNDCDKKQIAECIKNAMNDFGAKNRMDAINWRT